jgi:hypothetical protein
MEKKENKIMNKTMNKEEKTSKEIAAKATKAANYACKFANIMQSGVSIKTADGNEVLTPVEDEEWRQCYDANNVARSQLPPYWFVSNKGRLISLYNDKPYLLPPDMPYGRAAYHFYVHTADGRYTTKIIRAHNLCGLVFGDLKYGQADKIIEDEGLSAFNHNADIQVNGHHINGNKTDNDPDNIQFLTAEMHKVISNIPQQSNVKNINKKELDFIQKLSDQAAVEEPNQITILLTGMTYDKESGELIEDTGERKLIATDKITISAADYQKIVSDYTDTVKKWILDKAIDKISSDYSVDYFYTVRYLMIDQMDAIYQCYINAADHTLHGDEIDQLPDDLTDKTIIRCTITADKQVEYTINDSVSVADQDQN